MWKRFNEWRTRRETIRASFPHQVLHVDGTDFTLRRMQASDVDAALALEQDVYGYLPWDRMAFLYELQKTATSQYFALTLPDAAQLVAFIGISFKRTESHITNIAVSSQYQRRGIGRTLMKMMIDWSRTLGMNAVSLEVRLDNVHAQALYRELGFTDGRVRRNYYTRERADALDMLLRLDGQLADEDAH